MPITPGKRDFEQATDIIFGIITDAFKSSKHKNSPKLDLITTFQFVPDHLNNTQADEKGFISFCFSS